MKNQVLKKNENVFFTMEEDKKMFKAYQNMTNEEDKKKFVQEQVLLRNSVVYNSLCKIKIPQGVDKDDIIQEGHLLLQRCIELYDPSSNVKFYSYATQCIKLKLRQLIRAEMTKNDIYIPLQTKENYQKYMGFIQRWKEGHSEPPSNTTIEKNTGLTLNQIKLCKIIERYSFISKDTLIKTKEGAIPFQDILFDKNSTSIEDMVTYKTDHFTNLKMLEKIMEPLLTKTEFEIVCQMYGLKQYKPMKTMSDLAKIRNCSNQCIQSTLSRAIMKLQKNKKQFEMFL